MAAKGLKIGVTCYPSWGGSGIVATELAVSLAERGHQIHFITQSVPIRLKRFSENICFHEVKTHDYPVFLHTPYTLSLSAKMAEVASYYHLDLLHVHYAIPHAIAAYLAKQMMPDRKLVSVVTLHGTDITLVGVEPSFQSVTKFAIEQADAVTAVSEFLKKTTEESFETDKEITVIPNFVDTERFAPVRDEETRRRFAPEGEMILAHASNFRPVKNIRAVIEVFHRVQRARPARLLMIGDGPERVVAEKLARCVGIGHLVKFLGSQDNMEDLLPLADVFLLPSEHEGFGLAALEAMSTETPVVATSVGGLNEVVENGRNGFLADPQDVDHMTEVVLELLSSESLRQNIGRRGRETVLELFPRDKIVGVYESLYERHCG
jgi:N-acetyl-alpha-D-glucosaminyl L-malate synthase BshA